MLTNFFRRILAVAVGVITLCAHPILASDSPSEGAGARHGIALYGAPALPADFAHLPYANPDARKGGRFIDGQVGGFDSLNPHIQKGRVPWQLRFLAHESLMGRSYDEPFTLYGLLAETVEADPEGRWVEFHLRPEARFSDGSAVTVEDVIWSYETLGTQGHGRYRGAWAQVQRITPVGVRGLRISFSAPNRELALIMGMRPVLKKAQWEGRDFAESGLDVIPISSAPYVITDFEPNRFVELTRNPDYWARDLPLRRGVHNLDTLRMEFFTDATGMFEAFKSGALSTMRETSAAKWAEQYDFPAVAEGSIVKSEIPHQRPTGMTGLVMNTRKPFFSDWRVREAMILAFNFTYTNQILNGSALPRIESYFANSPLGMTPGAPAQGRVRALLEPFAASLLPGVLEGYALPVGDERVSNRGAIRQAAALLEEAGYRVENGRLTGPNGPVTFEILLQNGSSEVGSVVDIYVEALQRLGLDPKISSIDSAQHTERVNSYDFDMTYYRWGLSLSPGNEQWQYWGPAGVTAPGSRNLMGAEAPAIAAMIEAMLEAESQEDYVAAVKALDRVLTAGRYVVPMWHNPVSWIAHDATLKFPTDRISIYGDWIDFQPDVWWYDPE
jgi:peptide/nickel transport system substrate-binding protein